MLQTMQSEAICTEKNLPKAFCFQNLGAVVEREVSFARKVGGNKSRFFGGDGAGLCKRVTRSRAVGAASWSSAGAGAWPAGVGSSRLVSDSWCLCLLLS